jgi:hypothetical protein
MAKQTGEQASKDSTTETLARAAGGGWMIKGNVDRWPRPATLREPPFRKLTRRIRWQQRTSGTDCRDEALAR